jgi:hypothetical protein
VTKDYRVRKTRGAQNDRRPDKKHPGLERYTNPAFSLTAIAIEVIQMLKTK